MWSRIPRDRLGAAQRHHPHTLPSHTGRAREARTNSHANSDPPHLEPTSAHDRAAETPTPLHHRQADLTGKPVDLFMTDVENVTSEGQLNRLRHGQEIRGWEVSVQPTRGTAFPATVNVSAAYGSDGELSGLHWQLH